MCETTLRMTPPRSFHVLSSRSLRSQISIFAVLPFSLFYHSQTLYRVHRTAPANNRPSGFPERTPLKVSTISRDNHRTAANSFMHMCTHQYTCVSVYLRGMYPCARINIHGARKGEKERKRKRNISSIYSKCTGFFVHFTRVSSLKIARKTQNAV